MLVTNQNIKSLIDLGFKEIKKETYAYIDIKTTIYGAYITFKYCGKELPIIDKIESIEKIIQGIYEYKFN